MEEAFQSSDFLKTLKERSAANKDERRKELLNRYCYRQAEMGVGDCSGLRLIPGESLGLQADCMSFLYGARHRYR